MTSPAIKRLRRQLAGSQDRLLDEARRLQGRATWIITAGGAMAAIGGGLISFDEALRTWGLWLLLTGVLLIGVGTWLSNTISPLSAATLQQAHSVIDRADAAERTVSELRGDFGWIATMHAVGQSMREVVEAATQDAGDRNTRDQRYLAMLGSLVDYKLTLFGIGDEEWNFAIYLFDEDAGNLVCRACRRWSPVEEAKPHRIWKPGEGHVGFTFSKGVEVVSDDTMRADVAPLFAAPEHAKKDDDHVRYRSVASLPLKLDGRAFGILVATSDVPRRFFQKTAASDAAFDPVEPLRSAAGLVALLAHIQHDANHRSGG
ncbi:hypothetical protein [Salinarimonas sp.]|uniref:hypothetical protein n=1 Tax=Salinarimonas sp. TaxID=2766526 RepID=UPI00391D106A